MIGSELIAQPFASDKYVFPRPSAADYKADATSGSNLGTKNPDLRKKSRAPGAPKATEKNPAPVDLVTASGGGMDPDISPSAAHYQEARVATVRKMPVSQVKALIARSIETSGYLIGALLRVNVLKLNLALNAEKPSASWGLCRKGAPRTPLPRRPATGSTRNWVRSPIKSRNWPLGWTCFSVWMRVRQRPP